MSSLYTETAKEIIKNSIQSAVFIDDNLAVPFKANQKSGDLQISRELYNSFVRNNVSIDFYKYSPKNDWKEYKDFMFKGRDLVVLDWQLDNNTIEENTLKILQTAVNTPSLHFVCIYTSKNPSEFPDIAYAIKAYFSQYGDEIKQPTQLITEYLDAELPDGFTDVIKKSLQDYLKEYSLHNSLNKEVKLKYLKNDVKNLLGDKVANALQGELGRGFKSKPDNAFEAFGFGLNEEYLSDAYSASISMGFFLEQRFLVVDNTIILITNKNNPRPASLYSYFTEAVLKSSGNFLSLLSLDLKSILRDSSGFIGKELDKIDETAFFYHKDNVEPKDAFFDFVLELWKSNLASLLYSQNHLIKLFNEEALREYRNKKKIDSKIKKFKRKGNVNIDNDLAKLNYYYNSIENRNLGDFIRFGDIFNILDDKGMGTSEYLLCITAHCDCLHVENIKSEFFFVRGSTIKNSEGLAEGDAGNNSFILEANMHVFCIKWSNKPFTVFLENNKILKNDHKIQLGKSVKRITYVSTLKENYAQRIANNAFSHPMRVGIFFAKKQ